MILMTPSKILQDENILKLHYIIFVPHLLVYKTMV